MVYRRRKISKKGKSPVKSPTVKNNDNDISKDESTERPESHKSGVPATSSFQSFQTDEPLLLSQAGGEAYCEVGWDNYMPSQPSGPGNGQDTEELIQMFAAGSKQGECRNVPSTPPLLSLWLDSPDEGSRSNPRAANARSIRYPKRSRRGRPSGIRMSIDTSLLQQLASVMDQANQLDEEEETPTTPEASAPRRSSRLSERKADPSPECKLSIHPSSTDGSFELFESTARQPLVEGASEDSDRPAPKDNLSADDLWTDEELFDNDSFLRATQDIVEGRGLVSPKMLKRGYNTSTPEGAAQRKMSRLGTGSGCTPPGPCTVTQVGGLGSPLSPLVPKSSLHAHSQKSPFQSYRARTMHNSVLTSQKAKDGIISPSQHASTTTGGKFQFKHPTNRAPQTQRTVIPSKPSTTISHGCGEASVQKVPTATVNILGLGRPEVPTGPRNITYPQGPGRPPNPGNVPPQGAQFRPQGPGRPTAVGVSSGLRLSNTQAITKAVLQPPNKVRIVPASLTKSSSAPAPRTAIPEPLSTSTQVPRPCGSPTLNDVSLSDDLLATLAEPDELLDSQADPQLSPSQTYAQILGPPLHTLHTDSNKPAPELADDSDDDLLAEPELLAMIEEVEVRASQEKQIEAMTSSSTSSVTSVSSVAVTVGPAASQPQHLKYSQAEVQQKRLAALQKKQKNLHDQGCVRPVPEKQESVTTTSGLTLSQGSNSNSCSPTKYSAEDIAKKRQEALFKRRQKSPHTVSSSQESNSCSPIKCSPPEQFTFSKQAVAGSTTSAGNRGSLSVPIWKVAAPSHHPINKPPATNSQRNSPVKYDHNAIEQKRLEALKRRNNKLSLNRK